MDNKQNNVIELERALLGAILVNEKLFHNVKGRITAEEFFNDKNAMIFTAITELYDKGYEDVEVRPILNRLEEKGQLEKVGAEYIASLIESPGLPSNVTNYMKEISDKASLRNLRGRIDVMQKELAHPDVDASAVLEKLENDIIGTNRGTEIKEFIDSKTAIAQTIEAIERRAAGEGVSGVAVDFPSLDKITGGFQKGDLIILAARPSMGKTALALNMAANAAKTNNVAFYSLEMPTQQLYTRILSFTAYIDGNKLRDARNLTENEIKKMYLAKDKIENMKLFIDDTSGIKLSELVWKAKKLHKNKGLDMIVIDYLQLIVSSSSNGVENRQAEVSAISRTLKKLARDLNIPVIALSQLSRKVEQRESKVPMMSDLRESGAIEQDADIIAFVYRDAYYNREKLDENQGQPEVTDVIIAKHRNGSIGKVRLSFKPEHGLFMEKGDQ